MDATVNLQIILLLSLIVPETTKNLFSINYGNNQITMKYNFQPFFKFIKV